MRTRSILVSFPQIPFSINTLLPNARLASLAAGFLDAGHETRILDYGTVSVLDRLYPKPVKKAARVFAGRLFGEPSFGSLTTLSALVRLHNMERMRAKRAEHIYAETADELARETASGWKPDFIVFHVDHARAFHGVLAIAGRLHESAPTMPLVAAGSFIEDYGEALARFADVFACLCVRSPELALIQWAELLKYPESWGSIPNLVVHGRATRRERGLMLNEMPRGCYDAGIYPAAAHAGKFHIARLRSSRVLWEQRRCPGGGESAENRALSPFFDTKSPRLLADEMAAGAFHIEEAAPAANRAAAIAHEILGRGLHGYYSAHGALSGLNAGIFALLKASGCRAMFFPVDTGSQWLLNDFCRRDAGISEIEHILRSCRSAGIFTIIGVTYPCPADDYHTRAETLRLIMRARPQAVLAHLPQVPPTSAWGQRPEEFGFKMDTAAYLRNLAAGRPSLEWRAQAYPKMRGRTQRQAVSEHQTLVREIEQLGISTAITPEVALAADAAGYSGHERDYAALMGRHLFAGDAADIEAAIKQFNARVEKQAGASTGTMALPLAAVGN